MPERFEVTTKEADQRLDKLLRQHYPDLGFGDTQKLIRGGRVRVNGKRAKAAARIEAGAIITLPYQWTAEHKERTAERGGSPLDRLAVHQDETMMVINKPAGLAVQGGSAVATHVAEMIEGTDMRLVHRLDRDTSGLLVLSKGALNAKHLTQAFADHSVEKSYLALVPEAAQDEGRLDLPLKKILVGGEGMMAVAAGDEEAQEAITEFRVLARAEDGTCLIQFSPKTGRTHQLRVHAAHMFGGILGDSKYGDAHHRAKSLRLHAWRLKLPHPDTMEMISLEAALPADFSGHLARLEIDLPQEWSPT